MPSIELVTLWIDQLKTGDHRAAQRLWEGYFERLVHLARSKLQGIPRRAADEEDVALSAFDSFCRGAGRGRFPQLFDRDDLWQLLVVLTERKAIDLVHHERRQKRGGGTVEVESALDRPLHSSAVQGGMEQSSDMSRRPNSRPKLPKSGSACWRAWVMRSYDQWLSGKWKAIPITRLPPDSAASRGPSNAKSA